MPLLCWGTHKPHLFQNGASFCAFHLRTNCNGKYSFTAHFVYEKVRLLAGSSVAQTNLSLSACRTAHAGATFGRGKGEIGFITRWAIFGSHLCVMTSLSVSDGIRMLNT
ncbi:T. brucei spp.-specific protein [Trypanosoma brucei gambiense DAL972]|uniref:T. brucei spp.-specific protein n=1 Tax=Trypanosoma brucei gambiense (strain MHOM/CI/86/DAL972) TaxID=679716 RepID=D0A383_TRYB9|nr:T. brucei spp.-specific protein [Trypanosoma brucei gambiense DAL972]CBH15727.1 T. brucei spp.-specific protein [Trypanosoma brucei gambiense DAL972]|eukprot:XP_011777991.1 T. brucei spp.-specific protein [Trypanosoma brucei gambiense DAL972]